MGTHMGPRMEVCARCTRTSLFECHGIRGCVCLLTPQGQGHVRERYLLAPHPFPHPSRVHSKDRGLVLLYSIPSKNTGRLQKPWGGWQGEVSGTAGESQRAARRPQGGQETCCCLLGLSTLAVTGNLVMPQVLLPRCSRK